MHGLNFQKLKKVKQFYIAFIEKVNESNRKPNKLWVDQGRGFYNKLMQEWLNNNNILMYSTRNERKSVIPERFIKTLKMTANHSKYYLSYLNKLVDQFNKTYHHSINKKPINSDYSALTGKTETNPKAPKFRVNDRVRITKYKNIFSKGYTENWSREIFVIDSVFKIEGINGENIIGSFYEK